MALVSPRASAVTNPEETAIGVEIDWDDEVEHRRKLAEAIQAAAIGIVQVRNLLDQTGSVFAWEYDASSTVASDPGTGKFRIDNAAPGSATNIYINNITEYGLDANAVLKARQVNDAFSIAQHLDLSRAVLYQVSGAVVDNTGWHTVPVTALSSTTAWQASALCKLHLG